MELVRRRGGIFQQIDLAGELNDKEFVVGSGQRVIDEMDAGQALIAELSAEVGAGLRKKPEGDGCGLGGQKGLNGLDVAVVGERDVGGGEVLYRIALFVDYGNGDRNGRSCGRRGGSWSRRRSLGWGRRGRLGWSVGCEEGQGGKSCRSEARRMGVEIFMMRMGVVRPTIRR